jgi:hypothetical protein
MPEADGLYIKKFGDWRQDYHLIAEAFLSLLGFLWCTAVSLNFASTNFRAKTTTHICSHNCIDL